MTRTPCSIDDCDRPATARSWCNTHYHRWFMHGSPHTNLRPARSVMERFWGKIEIGDESECWLWTDHIPPMGYGYFSTKGTSRYAHRWSYEQFVGPIPTGLQIDHLCRVRNCVNPHHLEVVTGRVNILRGTSPPALNARKTHCLRGHPYSGDNLRMKRGKRICRTCHNAHKRASRRRVTAARRLAIME
jgi:hypothetical protein